jgi:HK97 gp10 family phage protein
MTFETGRLDRIIAHLSERTERMIAEEAQDVVRGAMANTTRVDTGTMRRGWHAQRVGRFAWRVGTNVFYAVFHEFGTTRLSAAPMLGPAVEAVRRARVGRARRLFRP